MPPHRTWLMVPFMHSERLEDQQVSLSCRPHPRQWPLLQRRGHPVWHGAVQMEACQCGTLWVVQVGQALSM